jgi:hypothetical protein
MKESLQTMLILTWKHPGKHSLQQGVEREQIRLKRNVDTMMGGTPDSQPNFKVISRYFTGAKLEAWIEFRILDSHRHFEVRDRQNHVLYYSRITRQASKKETRLLHVQYLYHLLKTFDGTNFRIARVLCTVSTHFSIFVISTLPG